MSYSDRKEGNYDYQRVSGQLKAQEKAQKQAIKAAQKAQKKAAKSGRRSSYTATSKNLTVDQVMADYDAWLSKQPKTADQVMADYNAWNADAEGWAKSQAVPQVNSAPAKTTTRKAEKKEEKEPEKKNTGATRVTFDPFSQERPDPTEITRGSLIPELKRQTLTDPTATYRENTQEKEARLAKEKEKQTQEERHKQVKEERLARINARSQAIKDERDQTYKAGRYFGQKDLGKGLTRAANKVEDTIRREQDDLYGRMTDEELAAEAARLESNAFPFLKSKEQRLLDREIEDRKKAEEEAIYGKGLKGLLNKGLESVEQKYAQRVKDYQESAREYQKQAALTDPSLTYRENPEERNARINNTLKLYASANGFSREGAKQDIEEQNQKALVQQWLDPSYKMSDKDRDLAKQIIEKYWDDPDWNRDDLDALSVKDNELASFAASVAKIPYGAAHLAGKVADDVIGTGLEIGGTVLDALPFVDGAAQAVRDARADYQKMTEGWANQMDLLDANAATQHPELHAAGNFIGQATLYAATNPAFDALASYAGLGLRGTAALEQVGQNVQDLLLDTLPEYERNIRNGMSQDEAVRQAFETQGWNALGNLAIPILFDIGEVLSGGKKAIMNYVKNAQAPDPKYLDELRAYRQNVLDPLAADADNVAKAAYQPNLSPLEMAAKNADAVDVALAGRKQAVNNLEQLAEQAQKQPEIKPEMPVNAADEVVEQAVKNELPRPAQDNPIIDSIEEARRGMGEGIPKAASQLDGHKMQVDNILSKYDFTVNDEMKTLRDAIQDDYVVYRKAILSGDVDAAETAGKKLRSDIGKLHRRAEKAIPGYQKDLNLRDITQGATTPAYSIRSARNLNIDADTILNNWNNSFLGSEFGEMTQEQYDAFLKEAQELGWVDELGKPTKEALGGVMDQSKAYDSIIEDALSEGGGNGKVASKIWNALYDGEKAGIIDMSDDEWRAVNDAIYQYAKEGDPKYLNEIDDFLKRNELMKQGPAAVEPLQSAKTAAKTYTPQETTARLTRNPEDIKPDIEAMKPQQSGGGGADNSFISEKTPDYGKDIRERNYAKNARYNRIEGIPDEVAAEFIHDPEIYNVLHNADTINRAQNIFDQGFNKAKNAFDSMVIRHDPAAIPLGRSIAKELSANGDPEGAAEIIRKMSQELTTTGQFSQIAAVTLVKDDPMTALHYLMKQIDAINKEGLEKFGKKWKNFELTKEEIKTLTDITPGDEKAITDAWNAVGRRLSMEYPSSMMDKLLEGRKIAMLLNLRTLERNPLANIPTLLMRWTSDRFEAVGQNVAHLIDPNIKVTQSITGSGRKGRRIAKEAFNSERVQKLLKDTPGKYEMPSMKNAITKDATIYKGTFLDHWIDDMTGRGIEKFAKRFLDKDIKVDGGIQALNKVAFGKEGVRSPLETFRNLTYKLLDLGDSKFVKENFVERLGSYIHAQGINSVKDIPDEAIQIAWEEAMKATYKDNSWAVKMLQGIRNKGIKQIPGLGRPLAEGAIPFVQAPGNIAARMVDYSALGGGIGIKDIVKGARSGDKNLVIKGIEEASKGLTGTGLAYLGYTLHRAGIITGPYSTDKDMRQYQKQTGYREFAIHVGDKYYTYDWAQPFAQELMAGTLLSEAIKNSDQYDSDLLNALGYEGTLAGKFIGGAKQSAFAVANSWFDESPLQGLQKLLSGGYSNEDGVSGNVFDTLVTDFAQSFIPASLNATAKTLDPLQRNTYDPNYFTKQANTLRSKIPGMTEDLPIKYDTWGKPIKTGETSWDAFVAKFINPGDFSYDRSTAVDKEIMRLYEEADNDIRVFPPVAGNTVGEKKLNNEEMSEYQKDMGERNYDLVKAYMKTDAYENTSDKDKVEVLNDIYGVSKAISERDLFDKKISDSSTYKKYVDIYDEYGEDGLIDYIDSRDSSKEDIKDSLRENEWYQNQDSVTKKKMRDEIDAIASNIAKAELGEDVDDRRVAIYEKYGAETLSDYMSTKQKAQYKTDKGQTTSSVYSTVNAMRDLSDASLKKLMPELLNFEKQNGEMNSNAEIYGKYGAKTLLSFYLNGYKVTGTQDMPANKMEATKAAQMFPEKIQEDMYNYYLNRQTTTIHASSSKAEQEVLDNQGMGGLQEFIRQEDTLKEFGSYEYDETAQKIFNEGGYPALKEYGATLQGLESRGVKGKPAYESYTHAIQQVPSLSMDQFSKEYKWIDSLGEGDSKDNGSISQTEILAAMNYRPREAEQIQKKYWTSDSYVPVLKNGTWKKKKVKKKK